MPSNPFTRLTSSAEEPILFILLHHLRHNFDRRLHIRYDDQSPDSDSDSSDSEPDADEFTTDK
ncbi:hypothetical protein D6C90_08593, partial [Aureobasidium pullulans]